MFQYILNNFTKYSNTPNDEGYANKTVLLRHDDYHPLYSIDVAPYPAFPARQLLTNDLVIDEFERAYGGGDWRGSGGYVKFIKACLDKKYYHLILLSNFESDSVNFPSKYRFKEVMTCRLTSRIISQNYYTHFRKNIISRSGASLTDIFDKIRLMNDWSLTTTRRNKGESNTYLTNLLFLGELSNEQQSVKSMKVLLCGMVKSTHIALARSYVLAGIPMPSSILELWIDESLEATGSRLKPLYRNNIKTKLQESGVQIRVFPDLSKELLHKPEFSFSTLEEQRTWISDILKEYSNVVAGRLVYKASDINTSNATITKNIEKVALDIEEVIGSIT